MCPEQAASLPGGHDQSQFSEYTAAACKPAPFSPHLSPPVAALSRVIRHGSEPAQPPGQKPLPVAATRVSTAPPGDVGIAPWAPGHQSGSPPFAASGASTASPWDAGIAAWAHGSQSVPQPVAATGASTASPRDAGIAAWAPGRPSASTASPRDAWCPWPPVRASASSSHRRQYRVP